MRSSLFQIPEEWTNTAPPKSKSPVPTAEPSESSAKSRLCEIPDELLNSVVNHLVVRLPEDLNKDCPDWPSLVALSLTNKKFHNLCQVRFTAMTISADSMNPNHWCEEEDWADFVMDTRGLASGKADDLFLLT